MSGVVGLVWVLSIVLAIVLLVLGFVLVRNDPGGKKRLGWAENAPRGVTLLFGILMIFGAVLLIVPPLLPALAWVAPLAAGIMAALMFAIGQSYLIKRDLEGAAIYILLIVLFVALAVARWPAIAGRFG